MTDTNRECISFPDLLGSCSMSSSFTLLTFNWVSSLHATNDRRNASKNTSTDPEVSVCTEERRRHFSFPTFCCASRWRKYTQHDSDIPTAVMLEGSNGLKVFLFLCFRSFVPSPDSPAAGNELKADLHGQPRRDLPCKQVSRPIPTSFTKVGNAVTKSDSLQMHFAFWGVDTPFHYVCIRHSHNGMWSLWVGCGLHSKANITPPHIPAAHARTCEFCWSQKGPRWSVKLLCFKMLLNLATHLFKASTHTYLNLPGWSEWHAARKKKRHLREESIAGLHFHICWWRLINKKHLEVIFTEDTHRERGIAFEELSQVSVIQWKLINTALNKCWRITSLLKTRFCLVNYLVFFLVQALHLSEPDSISQTVNKEISWPPVESNPFCILLKPVSTVQPSLPGHWDEGKVKLGPWRALGSKGTALSTDAMKSPGRHNHHVKSRTSQDLGLESCKLKKS